MLSDRQLKLLEAIITEYISSAEPVGSALIVEKYNIRYSPATVRNDMAKLLDQGYLEMLHTSSGRIPTTEAYKYFLEEMLEEEELDVLEEVALKQRLWANRYEFEKMLRQAVLSLSDLVSELVLVTTDDNHIISGGAVNLLDSREFWDLDVAKSALHLLDRPELLHRIFDTLSFENKEVAYLIGTELGNERFRECGAVVSRYNVGKRSGYLAVLGPSRMAYNKVIPAVRYTKNLIQELGGSW